MSDDKPVSEQEARRVVEQRLSARRSAADPEFVKRAEDAVNAGDFKRADYWKRKALKLNTKTGVRDLFRGLP